tara:strand:- start:34 stop:324 length:291 start_codon:yes stop_codon:yes gene_type:complete
MGAEVFVTESIGANANEAFNNARNDALYQYGHNGYSGSIAEKYSFVMIKLPPEHNVHRFIDSLIDEDDFRIDDKWGPAGCIKISDTQFIFFGWASS